MRATQKPGGTEGGEGYFLAGIGFFLAGLGLYLLFDSIYVTSGGVGVVSGMLRMGYGGGSWMTASMGVIFVPFVLGVVVLFYDARKPWGWWLFWGGIMVIAVEVLSRLRFEFGMKTTHLLLLLGLIGAGAGMILRAYREERMREEATSEKSDTVDN